MQSAQLIDKGDVDKGALEHEHVGEWCSGILVQIDKSLDTKQVFQSLMIWKKNSLYFDVLSKANVNKDQGEIRPLLFVPWNLDWVNDGFCWLHIVSVVKGTIINAGGWHAEYVQVIYLFDRWWDSLHSPYVHHCIYDQSSVVLQGGATKGPGMLNKEALWSLDDKVCLVVREYWVGFVEFGNVEHYCLCSRRSHGYLAARDHISISIITEISKIEKQMQYDQSGL